MALVPDLKIDNSKPVTELFFTPKEYELLIGKLTKIMLSHSLKKIDVHDPIILINETFSTKEVLYMSTLFYMTSFSKFISEESKK